MQGCDCIYHEEHEAHEEPSKDSAHHTPYCLESECKPRLRVLRELCGE